MLSITKKNMTENGSRIQINGMTPKSRSIYFDNNSNENNNPTLYF